MSVYIDFKYTIKAKTKQDYNLIKSTFKNGDFEDMGDMPQYMKEMIIQENVNEKLKEFLHQWHLWRQQAFHYSGSLSMKVVSTSAEGRMRQEIYSLYPPLTFVYM